MSLSWCCWPIEGQEREIANEPDIAHLYGCLNHKRVIKNINVRTTIIVSADLCFSLNSDERGIAENSLRLPFTNPAMLQLYISEASIQL